MSTAICAPSENPAIASIREVVDSWENTDQSERKVCMEHARDVLDSCRYDRESPSETYRALVTSLDVLADEARACLQDIRALAQGSEVDLIAAARRAHASDDVLVKDDAQVQHHGDAWVQAWVRVRTS